MPVTAPKFRNQFHVSYAPTKFVDAQTALGVLQTETSVNIQMESSANIEIEGGISAQEERARQVSLNTFRVIVEEST